jgi:hypothetical protein
MFSHVTAPGKQYDITCFCVQSALVTPCIQQHLYMQHDTHTSSAIPHMPLRFLSFTIMYMTFKVILAVNNMATTSWNVAPTFASEEPSCHIHLIVTPEIC